MALLQEYWIGLVKEPQWVFFHLQYQSYWIHELSTYYSQFMYVLERKRVLLGLSDLPMLCEWEPKQWAVLTSSVVMTFACILTTTTTTGSANLIPTTPRITANLRLYLVLSLLVCMIMKNKKIKMIKYYHEAMLCCMSLNL
jgi:hypothetical protein